MIQKWVHGYVISLGKPQPEDPLTRPAPAGESAGCGPPSPPRGRGLSFIFMTSGEPKDHGIFA
jgi:hypothetical protein